MKDNKLIASLVVFKELYDSNKDIYEIISEFIKTATIIQKKWTFNATSISKSVDEVFNFNIPVAVIKSAIKKHLIPKNFVRSSQGEYIVNNIKEKIDNKFKENYEIKINIYNETINQFIKYIEKQKEQKLDEKNINELKDSIINYLLGNENGGKYVKEISKFIVIKQNDKEFRKKLNVIKEGLVLYTGIQYTSNLNELGSWKNELTIFLDTNIIFNLIGYSGKVYQKIFNDFHNLVKEINNLYDKNKIHLKFFIETKKEINEFFNTAISIFESPNKAYPYASAMKNIINGCNSKSDILMKRIKLFNELERLGIYEEEDDEINYYENHQYVVEGGEVIEEIKKLTKKNINENKIRYYLKLFTKINVLREGINDKGFDNCRYILLTSSGFANFLAFSEPVKQNKKDIPFATNLDFITDKFWFKLNKGFSNKSNLPLSFDFVTKAQIILSAHIDNAVEEKYTHFQNEVKKGTISIEDVRKMSFELRGLTIQPEYLTEHTVDDALSSIDEYSYENFIRENEEKELIIRKGEEAINEIKRRDRIERNRKTKKVKIHYKFCFFKDYLIAITIILFATTYIYKLFIRFLIEKNDSKLTIIGFLLGLITPLYLIIKKYGRKLIKNHKNKFLKAYKKRIKDIIK